MLPDAGSGRQDHGSRSARNPLRAALIVRHFEEEILFVRPPLALQKVILGPNAGLARMLGYKAEYPYPHPRQREQVSV